MRRDGRSHQPNYKYQKNTDRLLMAEDTKAIFLSYASQDAVIARRIADALRSAGLDVWFDQSELRGGDAWDVSIR